MNDMTDADHGYQAMLDWLPKPGTRVRLTRTVERYPHFSAGRGMEGVVTEATGELFAVLLDDFMPGAEEWDNEVHWYPRNCGEWPFEDIELASQKSEMRPIRGVSLRPVRLIELVRERARQTLRYRRLWQTERLLADAAGMPDEYVKCEFCGGQAWRFPPHGLEQPCPYVVQVFEAQGMKMEADRMLSVRSGVHMEELRALLEDLRGEDDD